MNKIIRLILVLMITGLLSPVFSAYAENSRAECIVSFEEFQHGLETAITKSGGNAQKELYHFVILMNTVRTNGPRARAMRDLYNCLLNQYMVQYGKSADKVSFSPFELDIWGKSVWNETFRRSKIAELYALAPKSSQVRVDSQAGHDDERALLSALGRVELPASTVIIILSDSEVSEPPVHPGKYKLTTQNPEYPKVLESVGFQFANRGRIEGQNVDGVGRPVSFAIFYSIYTSTNLRPLTQLTSVTRNDLITPPEPPPPPPPSLPTLPWGIMILAVVILLLIIAFVWYWSFINKTRFVQIGGLQGSVHYGKPTYIGGDPEDQKCIAIPELNGRQKVAVLEIQPTGKVVLRNHGTYQVSSGATRNMIILSGTEKTISVKNTQAGNYIQFRARVVSN